MREKVEQVLEQIRPQLEADGGGVELVNIDDEGVVTVKLLGACSGCMMRNMTLTNGIERVLKQHVPEVKQVVAA